MSAITTSGNFGDTYMSRVKKLFPNMRTAAVVNSSRSKRDTIDEARAKVAEKLRKNRAFVLDPDNTEEPDSVFKKQSDGMYGVGVKYGNRYLEGVFDGGKFITNVAPEARADLLEVLTEAAEAGEFDSYITPVMKANVEARNKAGR
jgi:hypothetical protein